MNQTKPIDWCQKFSIKNVQVFNPFKDRTLRSFKPLSWYCSTTMIWATSQTDKYN